jgi:hypothetical protein
LIRKRNNANPEKILSNNQYYWSGSEDHCAIPGCTETSITIDDEMGYLPDKTSPYLCLAAYPGEQAILGRRFQWI